jgi:hypothetical protein
LAATGIAHGVAKFGPQPCFTAGTELLRELGGVGDSRRPRPIDPTRITNRANEWQVRVCYAPALLSPTPAQPPVFSLMISSAASTRSSLPVASHLSGRTNTSSKPIRMSTFFTVNA